MSKTVGRFAVDTEGLRNQMKGREPWRLVQELVSNAFDEPSVTEIRIVVDSVGDSCRFSIIDNGSGFERIKDVYTLFGESKRMQSVNQRGRFNMGEKQFFAICTEGYIETAGKRITFKGDQRIEEDVRTDVTKIVAELPFTENQTAEIVKMLKRVIVPQDKHLLLNGGTVIHRAPIRSFQTDLVTLELSKSNRKVLTEVTRTATVSLYPVEAGEKSWLYEMGIPVQSINTLWHVDIGQKVPLSPNRDSVRESYLKTLYAALVNNVNDLIPEEKVGNNFVTIGLAGATAEAAKEIFKKRFDTDEVFLKGMDSRSNEAAMEHGALVDSRTLDYDTRAHLLELGVIQRATEAFPTQWVTGAPVELTPEMEDFAKVVKRIASETIERDITVRFVSAPDADDLANYQPLTHVMTFNVGRLGDRWFEDWTEENLGVVIHELAHDKVPNAEWVSHFTHDFVHEIERIAGIIAVKGLNFFLS